MVAVRGHRHLTENKDLGLWVQSPAAQQFFNPGLQKIINIKVPSVRVIVICSCHRLLWRDSDKGVDCPLTLLESIPHKIIIIIGSGLFLKLARVTSESGKFLPKIPIFSLWIKKNLIILGQKISVSKADRTLIYCGSKVCSGWVESRPISSFASSKCLTLSVTQLTGILGS